MIGKQRTSIVDRVLARCHRLGALLLADKQGRCRLLNYLEIGDHLTLSVGV